MQPARAGPRLTDVIARRLPVLLAAVATSAALASGCSASVSAHPAAVTQPATTGFSAMGLSFRYPAAWRHASFGNDSSSFSGNIVDLSTSRLHDRCIGGPAQGALVCSGFPVDTLAPGGVLVMWTDWGFPNWHMPKPNATIGGRPAVETKTGAGSCATLGAAESITVMISRDVPDNWYQMDACLRGPGLTQLQAEIATMLSTVRIAKGDLHPR